ncbi:MAG: histidine kinase N-terminal 7TM domain-containing protein [Patescibacteria group bacterium]
MDKVIFIAGILNLLLGIATVLRARTRVQRQFGYLVLLIAVWVFVNFTYFQLPRYPYVHLSYAVGIFLVLAIFFWVAAFVKQRIRTAVRWVFILVAIAVSGLSMVPGWVIGNQIDIGPVQYIVTLGPVFNLFAAVASILLIAAAIVLLRAFFRAQGLERLRMTYVVLAFVVPITFIIVVDFVLPIFGVLWSAGLDSPISLVFASFIAFAIFRHRFFDIRVVIRKSLVQFVTFVLLFAIYAYALLLVQRSTSSNFTLSSNTSLLVTIFIIGLTIEPLRKGIYKFIDGIVANREKDRQEALKRMQLMAASTMLFQTLLERTQQELGKTFGVRVDFLLAERRVQALTQFPAGQMKVQLEDVVGQRIAGGRVLIADELPYRIENGETSLKVVHEWMLSNDVSAIVPIGAGEDMVGAFLFRGMGKVVYTADMVRFMKDFQEQSTFAFASAYAYKLAIERITIK